MSRHRRLNNVRYERNKDENSYNQQTQDREPIGRVRRLCGHVRRRVNQTLYSSNIPNRIARSLQFICRITRGMPDDDPDNATVLEHLVTIVENLTQHLPFW